MTDPGAPSVGLRPEPGDGLDAVGRAKRFKCTRGEFWVLPASDESVARRLVTLGASHLAGFVDVGLDEDSAWLVRRTPSPTAFALAKGERVAWTQAVAIVRDLARALTACEEAGLFPGALRPSEVILADDGAWFSADSLVDAMLGAPKPLWPLESSPRWTPPEQAGGAPWDAAANRYVLGLIAYRLIAGAMPFGGAGLRHAMRDHTREAAPFEDSIARQLLPGVQSFVLRLLDPEKNARPARASDIAQRCDELLGTAPAPAEVSRGPRSMAPGSKPTRTAIKKAIPHRRPVWLAAFCLTAGLTTAGVLVATAAPRNADSTEKPAIRPVAALASTAALDCAPCHARHVAEWQRSVMAHAAKSPLFGALESLVEEQVGRDARCPNGAGILRRASSDVCRDERTGIAVTGSGGEHWCVNCHAPGENLRSAMPAWSAFGSSRSRAPLRDVLPAATLEGISCASCHQTIGPVAAHGTASTRYEGNATWISVLTGQSFRTRPEDLERRFGIGNSGYDLDPRALLGVSSGTGEPIVHRRAPPEARSYLRSSEFCGSCHDVRLFGTDVLGVRERGEHFKRLRNGYSEWREWADGERRSGRSPATCQGCHMSLYPGVCAPGEGQKDGCPDGTHFSPRAPGETTRLRSASSSAEPTRATPHYFTSVDVPLAEAFSSLFADETSLDAVGLPLGLRARRDVLLRHTFRFELAVPQRVGARLEIPIAIQNTGAGHKVPGGFSQEREVWVDLTVKDARGNAVYEVGKLAAHDADLRDKIFLRISTSDDTTDARGRPLGLFGADVIDGPDAPQWRPNPARGGTTFRGRGLINLQNGFLRCVRCIGLVDANGACQAAVDQGKTRADRFDDGAYEQDTGECRSNLSGGNELFETYFPVGALDAERGVAKAPDAILDTRSAPPGVVLTYTYDLDVGTHPPPFDVEARLRFRAFPPYLIRAFAAYESKKNAQGLRPSGPQVTEAMLRRIDVIDIASTHARVP